MNILKNKEIKNNITKIILMITLLLILTIGISFAYFTANITGSETETTLTASGGIMNIVYGGGANINMNNIYPREEVWGIKNFTVTGNNTTDLIMYYNISLIVQSNTFSSDALKYKLIFTNTNNNGEALVPVGMQSIPTGTNNLVIANGSFVGPTSGNKVHTYSLEIYFPDTGVSQNENQEKTMSSYVKIEEGIKNLASNTQSKLKETILFANNTQTGINTIQYPDLSFREISPGPGPVMEYKLNTPYAVSSISQSQYGSFLYNQLSFSETKGIHMVLQHDEDGSPYDENGELYTENLELLEPSYTFTQDDVGKYFYNYESGVRVIFDEINYTTTYNFLASFKINEVQGGIVTNATKYTTTSGYYENYINEGLFKFEDDYGTSYYYRGGKNLNNNIIFAEHQWKIIRINGDGSIRLLYNGTCPNNSCSINSTGTTTRMGTSTFNVGIKDNKYLGYMYSPSGGAASTSREQVTTNLTSSSIKIFLDSWYSNNLLGKGYESYISDTLFCNDRQLQSEVGGLATGTGFGQSATYYAAHERYDKKNPSLKCGLKNDRFTVTDTAIGNGALTYPIGLLTIDEVSLAGLTSESYYTNNNNYLYVGRSYFTLSPAAYLTDITAMFHVHNHYAMASSVGDGKDVRGVINLKPNTPITGTGTTTDPYIVK